MVEFIFQQVTKGKISAANPQTSLNLNTAKTLRDFL
jgi:hypothetical protein